MNKLLLLLLYIRLSVLLFKLLLRGAVSAYIYVYHLIKVLQIWGKTSVTTENSAFHNSS